MMSALTINKPLLPFSALLLSGLLLSGLLVTASVQAWDPPARNGVKPGPLFKQNFSDVLDEISDRSDSLLRQFAGAADESALQTQGQFLLESGDFANLQRYPLVSEGHIWQAGKYGDAVPLEFQTLDLTELAGQPNADLALFESTLDDWRRYLRSQPRPDIDSQVLNQVGGFYADIEESVASVTEDADDGIQRLAFMARYQPLDGASVTDAERPIAALAIGSFNTESGRASLDYVASNPYALVSRSSRAEGVVGSSGTPLIDYSMRDLSQMSGVSELFVDAQSSRVGSFASSRGFELQCDAGISNQGFGPGFGDGDEGGIRNPGFDSGDDDVSPYD